MFDPSAPDFLDTPVRRAGGVVRRSVAPPGPPAVRLVTILGEATAGLEAVGACVLAQTLADWRWTIVATGDRPAGIDADPRIEVVAAPATGAVAAVNGVVLGEEPADVVVSMEATCLLEPTALEHLWWYLESHPGARLVGSHWVRFGDRHQPGDPLDLGAAVIRDRVMGPVVAVRTADLRLAGGFDARWPPPHHRDALAARFAAAGTPGHMVGAFLAWERIDVGAGAAAAEERAATIVAAVLRDAGLGSSDGPLPAPDVEADPGFTGLPERIPGHAVAKSAPRVLVVLPYLFVGGWSASRSTSCPSSRSVAGR